MSDKEIKGKLRRKTVSIYTLGCKVNQYETDAMAELFRSDGYEVVDPDEFADVYIINTCTVTNLGDRKSRQFIRRAKKRNPESIVAVVGCYSQVAPDDIMAIDGVNLVIGTNERKRIVELVQDITVADKVSLVGDIMKVRDFEELKIEDAGERTRAFIKIQEGCNMYCSYCIIPYARGPVRSRDPENVLDEVRRLSLAGFKEVVVTGIHVASYGKDLKGVTLMDLLKEINGVDGIERIRLSSLEPRLMDDQFVDGLSKLSKFCDHFHLSLQSGSDTVLKRMNRKYDTSEYMDAVERIRASFDEPSFTTDVIVGFPGETDEEFRETVEFVKRVKFHQLHVFKYSPKKGTPAASMENQIHGDVKSKRSEELIELSSRLERDYMSRFAGKRMSVLFEDFKPGNAFEIEGHSTNYIRVSGVGSMGMLGEICDVSIEGVRDGELFGKIESRNQ
jgi:threonylcarbamoyladenosine tRNA methylthiotransferase MtaB